MKEAETFAGLAARYCEFIEHAEQYELAERMLSARVLVLELYRSALELPVVEPVDGVDAGPSPARPPSWPGIARFDSYFETLEVFDVESRVGAGQLSDDLLDIYFDLRRGLDLWRSGARREAAVWEWRFHFDAHWGTHAVGALRALHHGLQELRPRFT